MVGTPEFCGMLRPRSELSRNLVRFEIDDRVGVEPEEIKAAQLGVELGWSEAGLKQTSVTIAFGARITVHGKGYTADVDAIYMHDTNTIAFGLDTIRGRYPGLPLARLLLLLGAHEATHKAQLQRGEQPARCAALKPGDYSGRHEVEAAMVSVLAHREVFPDQPLHFSAGGYQYRTHPEPYCEIE